MIIKNISSFLCHLFLKITYFYGSQKKDGISDIKDLRKKGQDHMSRLYCKLFLISLNAVIFICILLYMFITVLLGGQPK